MVLAACSPQADPRKPASAATGTPVLRVLYRDDKALMLLTLRASSDAPAPPRDCAAPLLIDPATGAAHALSLQDVAARLKTMQLAAATPGHCEADALRRK